MLMSDIYRKRIADFLSKYIDLKDCRYGFGDDKVIIQGIKILIENDIFTPDSLKKTAIETQGIIISDEFINDCLKD